jgi:hypothetical protein
MLMVNFVTMEVTVVTATRGTLILVNQVKKTSTATLVTNSHKCAQVFMQNSCYFCRMLHKLHFSRHIFVKNNTIYEISRKSIN